MVRQRSAKPSLAGSIPAVASINFSLPTPENFAFAATVESHGWYQLAPCRWSRDERVMRRPEAIGGKVVDLEIRHARGALQVTASGDDVGADALVPRLRRMFQLDVDTREWMALTRTSATHAWVEAAGFSRLLCGSTLFEDIVKIIATTNVTWSQTKRMIELLVELCGRRSSSGHAAFPDAEDVARVSAEELQERARLGYRAKSLHALASGIVSGEIDLDAIAAASQSTEELYARYRTLPGIGPYGAAHLLAMDGRHDFIAVDTEFRRFVRDRYHKGRTVRDTTMLRHYAKWGRWKYLAYWSELHRAVAERLQPGGGEDQ